MTLAADGFAAIGRVLDDDDLAALRAAADALTGAAAPGPYGRIVHDPWRRAPAFAERVARAAPAAIAAAGHALVLFQDHVIAKTPGATGAIHWHQDYAYWPLDAPAGLTLWIALDDADGDNGCLRYRPGTHRLGERRAADFVDGGATMPRRPDLAPLDDDLGGGDAIAVPVLAGHAIVHHPLVWHMSAGNASSRPRRAWSITWLAPDVRWDPAHAPHPFTVMSSRQRGDALDPERFPRFAA
jgi:ectoine hydroxylase-related dioxygenase (phytanoyl-CoA dioxygenase family)